MGDKKKIATDLADKKVTDAKDDAKAASTSIKNSGEVETLVKNVKEVASKSVADKAAESSTALASVAGETKSTADIARALSSKLAANIANFDSAIGELKTAAP